MRNNKPRAHYKKPKNNKKNVIATVKIVLTAAMVAVLGLVFYFAWRDGWESVFAWFGGKYACMVVIILVIAITAAMWLFTLVKQIRSMREDE